MGSVPSIFFIVVWWLTANIIGMERVDFKPYQREQLMTIVQSRLNTASKGLEGSSQVIQEDAVRLACARVSGITGDARRVLDVCR